MMVVYHGAYDLAMFHGWAIDPFSGGWWALARTTLVLFLIVSGMSFAVSWNRTPMAAKYFRRGLWILTWGMVVSLATAIVDPETFVRFGVLHLIGTGTLLLPFFARFRSWNVIVGMALMLASSPFPAPSTGSAGSPLLIPLGIPPASFTSVDYVPLIPWFGVMLIGTGIGSLIYGRWQWRWVPAWDLWKSLGMPGRYSLWIYLVHQPILLLLLQLLLNDQ